MTRTDLHRPSVLVPTDYTFVTSFAHPRYDIDGELVDEGFGFEEIGYFLTENAGVEVFGDTTRCGSCGARFRQGALFQHVSGEAVFVGRDCADTMEVLADWSRVDAAAANAAHGRKLAMQRQRKAAQIADLLAAHEGLEDALTTDHYIVRDIRSKLSAYGSLSAAQVALVFKIADETVKGMVEVNVPAPTGRVTFTGKVVSIKYQAPYCYGAVGTYKATIKVEAEPRKVWLAWVTVPSNSEWNKGDTVTVTASLEIGDSAHFAFGKRPKAVAHVPATTGA
jgi:hypothetical protein